MNKIILMLAIGFAVIGVHQSVNVGPANGYWALMLALVLFFLYTYRKRK